MEPCLGKIGRCDLYSSSPRDKGTKVVVPAVLLRRRVLKARAAAQGFGVQLTELNKTSPSNVKQNLHEMNGYHNTNLPMGFAAHERMT